MARGFDRVRGRPRGPGAGRFAALALAAALGGCATGILDPKGPVGAAQRSILIDATVIMAAIVLPTIAATLAFAWWFRASNPKAEFRPTFTYSGRVELVVWSIPLLTVLFLGGIAYIGSHQLDPFRPIESKGKPLEVQVVSLDWKWLFIYPEENVASINELVVPAGTPVHFTLTSSSVMNTFFVPQLGSMIYTMNGMATQLWLRADQEGTYRGRSAHFSGDGFPAMQFDVRAVSADGFAQWLAGARAGTRTLDAAAYDALAKQSVEKPSTFSAVEPHLFHGIVGQERPPGPGPEAKPREVTSRSSER